MTSQNSILISTSAFIPNSFSALCHTEYIYIFTHTKYSGALLRVNTDSLFSGSVTGVTITIPRLASPVFGGRPSSLCTLFNYKFVCQDYTASVTDE
jgi:hypothetical protein